jgi:hypothetical protein
VSPDAHCEYSPATADADGDGHRAPLPGRSASDPSACGDDCDDSRSGAFPGAHESCDGVDNDCDGVIDNGSVYLSSAVLPGYPAVTAVADPSHSESGNSGIAFGQGAFLVAYWAKGQEPYGYLSSFSSTGVRLGEEKPVTKVQAPSFGPTLAFGADDFGAAWPDARYDNNYEIFFARFDGDGGKLGADLRVTQAPDFSLNPELLFDSGHYIVVFDDRRDESTGGTVHAYGQIIDENGKAAGSALQLSPDGVPAEFPDVAATAKRLGVVYTVLQGTEVGLGFRSFDKEFGAPTGQRLIVGQDVQEPTITAVGDYFLVTWALYLADGPGDSIQGALLDDQGNVLAGPAAIASGGKHARSHATLSFGDRVLLSWADDLAGEYEIYAKVLDQKLGDVEARRRLTDDPIDNLGPGLAMSDDGHVGLVFDRVQPSQQQALMMTLGCK